MWHDLLGDARFHASLLNLDRRIAAEARVRGCPVCGGALHVASYPRKPRGVAGLPDEHDLRLSFCCAQEGCRKRTTPASVRFLGRRVYLGTIVVLVAVLRHGAAATRIRDLQDLVGVSRRTVERWCRWWRTALTKTAFWRGACGGFAEPVVVAQLPVSLLERFQGAAEEQLLRLLRFLGPLTGGLRSRGI